MRQSLALGQGFNYNAYIVSFGVQSQWLGRVGPVRSPFDGEETMPKIKILCIEDEPQMIDLLRLILETHGYEVVGAEGGQQGLAMMRLEKPDLILLDLMMPDMDGGDVYQRMKQEATLQDIPVIIVTAKAAPIDKVLWINIAKVDDYVTKPFGPDELIDSIERVLARRQPHEPDGE